MTDANTTHSNPLSTPLSPLQGKVALITGAARALAKALPFRWQSAVSRLWQWEER